MWYEFGSNIRKRGKRESTEEEDRVFSASSVKTIKSFCGQTPQREEERKDRSPIHIRSRDKLLGNEEKERGIVGNKYPQKND